MCGIAGFYRKEDRDPDSLKRMADVMVHRGPDADGFFIEDGVHFAHRRLSIVDLEGAYSPCKVRAIMKWLFLTGRSSIT